MKNKIEIELRGFFKPEEKSEIQSKLFKNGIHGEVDNRETLFYMINGGTLKIAKSSNGSAKVALKKGDFVSDVGLVEIEAKIDANEVNTFKEIFHHLGYTDTQLTKQERTNYLLEDGIELALKYSRDWGHHFEVDMLVDNNQSIDENEEYLRTLLKKYGLSVATEEEISALKERVDRQYKE